VKTPISGFRHLQADGSFVVELDGVRYELRPEGRPRKGHSVVHRLLHDAKRRAKVAKLPEPTIDASWIKAQLDRGVCAASGRIFTTGVYAPTIARKDRTRPFTPENCWAVTRGMHAALNAWGGDVGQLAHDMTEWLRTNRYLL
jgi:hypothetical protein